MEVIYDGAFVGVELVKNLKIWDLLSDVFGERLDPEIHVLRSPEIIYTCVDSVI